jgi:hypothetical protein
MTVLCCNNGPRESCLQVVSNVPNKFVVFYFCRSLVCTTVSYKMASQVAGLSFVISATYNWVITRIRDNGVWWPNSHGMQDEDSYITGNICQKTHTKKPKEAFPKICFMQQPWEIIHTTLYQQRIGMYAHLPIKKLKTSNGFCMISVGICLTNFCHSKYTILLLTPFVMTMTKISMLY